VARQEHDANVPALFRKVLRQVVKTVPPGDKPVDQQYRQSCIGGAEIARFSADEDAGLEVTRGTPILPRDQLVRNEAVPDPNERSASNDAKKNSPL